MTGLSRRRSRKVIDAHEQATTDAPITMATMELDHARLAQANRNHALLEARSPPSAVRTSTPMS
jgi:hypothetical protein